MVDKSKMEAGKLGDDTDAALANAELAKQVADLSQELEGARGKLNETETALEAEMGKVAEIMADRDRASDAVGTVQRERDELSAELAKLGAVLVPFDQAGYAWPPEVATDVDKVLIIIAQATEAHSRYEALQADYTEVVKQRDAHAATIATLKAEPRVQKGPKPPKPRAAGPLSSDELDAMDADALFLELSTKPHTVIFSDGARELPIAPIVVAAGAWARVPAGVMLRDPHTIKPETAVTLAGFAVLDDSGKQIGWSALMTPQRIPAGQEAKLDRQIVF